MHLFRFILISIKLNFSTSFEFVALWNLVKEMVLKELMLTQQRESTVRKRKASCGGCNVWAAMRLTLSMYIACHHMITCCFAMYDLGEGAPPCDLRLWQLYAI